MSSRGIPAIPSQALREDANTRNRFYRPPMRSEHANLSRHHPPADKTPSYLASPSRRGCRMPPQQGLSLTTTNRQGRATKAHGLPREGHRLLHDAPPSTRARTTLRLPPSTTLLQRRHRHHPHHHQILSTGYTLLRSVGGTRGVRCVRSSTRCKGSRPLRRLTVPALLLPCYSPTSYEGADPPGCAGAAASRRVLRSKIRVNPL